MTGYDKKDPQTIQAMFNSIAKDYDRTNAVLSFSLHRRWNRALVDNTLAKKQPERFLDLCCGTGEIAYEFLARTSHVSNAYMLDFSEQMLECAKNKAKDKNLGPAAIHYLKADAQAIPLPSDSINCATMAYGIRNIKSPLLCMQEVYRVLTTGGVFGILELTKPENPLLRMAHSIYLHTCFPVLGKILTSNKEAYRYLCNSIHTFIPPKDLEKMLVDAGFKNIQRKPLSGGIATLLIGEK